MSAKVATVFVLLFLLLIIVEAAPASESATSLEKAHNGPHVIPPIEPANPLPSAAGLQHHARKQFRRKKRPSNGVKTLAQRDAAQTDYYYYYYYY